MWIKTLLLVLALGHLIFGLFALYAPESAANLISVEMLSTGARGEVRAVFGGLVGAMGLGLLWGSRGGPRATQWLLALGVMYSGLVVGRVFSLALDGLSAHTGLAGVVEAAMAGVLFYAAGQLAPGSPAPAAADAATQTSGAASSST